jgi:hypothetical protein
MAEPPPPESSAVGGSVVAVDALPPVVVVAEPVEATLTDALSKAAAAGAWTAVGALARELGARREVARVSASTGRYAGR